MTRGQLKKQIILILEDIEPTAADDTDLYIPTEEIERAAESIMKLWDKGYTYDLTSNSRD